MKIIAEHLVLRNSEFLKVSIIYNDRYNQKYLLYRNNKVIEISREDFQEYDKNLYKYLNSIPADKTPISDWVKKMDDRISVRLKNVLLNMEFNNEEFQYIEDIKSADIRRERHAGIKTANEFYELTSKP